MTDREAMQQALEALELLSKQPIEMALDYADNAIEVLRERLAQQEQEQESVRDLLISAAAMAVVMLRNGTYKRASDVADAVLDREVVPQPEQELVACQYAKDVAMPEYRCVGKCQYAHPEQEPVALEAVYETIIQWDEGGGKRSRRELARRIVALYTIPPQRKPLPPQSPCEMTQAEGKMFKLGWLECEAAHGIKEEHMTRDEITRMARDAGFVGFDGENKCLRKFAALVAAAEREACAKVCEEEICNCCWDDDARAAAEHLAATIRARGNT